MKSGTVVEREYSVSNMSRYQDAQFLSDLDEISAKEGITILNRIINKEAGTVRIKARFDSDHWDVCQSLDFLVKHGVSVEPISDYVIITEIDTRRDKAKEALNWLESQDCVVS